MITMVMTTIRMTATGMEIPRIKGKLTEDVEEDGLKPFATKALEVTPNPAMLIPANPLALFKVEGPFPLESIWPLV